jgi:hypothetical protein
MVDEYNKHYEFIFSAGEIKSTLDNTHLLKLHGAEKKAHRQSSDLAHRQSSDLAPGHSDFSPRPLRTQRFLAVNPDIAIHFNNELVHYRESLMPRYHPGA